MRIPLGMGFLDRPLIAEMDALEKKARRGDEQALLRWVYSNLPTIKRIYVDRFTRPPYSLGMRAALEKAGIAIVCIR